MSSLCAPRDVLSFTFDCISRYFSNYSSHKNRSNFLLPRNLNTQFYDLCDKLCRCGSGLICHIVVLR